MTGDVPGSRDRSPAPGPRPLRAEGRAKAARACTGGRRRRARGAGGVARQTLDQARVQGVGARSRDPVHGPDHARRRRYGRQGGCDVREGGAPQPHRPVDPPGGRRLPVPARDPRGAWSVEGLERQGRERGRLVPGRARATRCATDRDPRGRRDRRARGRHRAQPLGVPRRAVRAVLRGARSRARGRGCRTSQGDHRGGRARQLRPDPAGFRVGDGGRRRLHQDVHGQDRGERHAAERALHDGGRSRFLPRDRAPRRRQGRRWRPGVQAGSAVSGPRLRDPRPRVDDAGPVPDRRLDAAQRRADADRQGADRPLPVSRLLHDRLMADIAKKASSALEESQPVWEYADSPESTEIVKLEDRYGLFIGGELVVPKSGRWFETINPATEETLAQVAEAGPEDVSLAVKAARRAWTTWRKLPGSERAKYLYRIARQLQERSREFAVLETMDGGKPIKESRDIDIPLAAAHFFYYAGWADKLDYAFPNRHPRPIGVAGQVIPWNFPLLMAAWKLAPALATGNTVVLKPAETTPLTALLLTQVIQEAGLPPGVVNIVTGAGPTGAALVEHDDVDKIAFTGSTEVGKIIRRTVAGTGKRLTLELGGKAANIGFEDAPLDQAVEGVINGIFFNQGHVCCAGSRLLVQEPVFEPLLEKLKDRLQTLRVGNPLDKNTDIGAINSRAQLEKIEELVASGVEEGGEMYQPECVLPERGFWFRPTLFTNVSQSHRIAREEIFGPVLSILTFRTPAEAVEKANNTPYGLSAGIWTEKGSRILWMAERMKAGVVWANTFNRFDPASPFGGYKESGFGREGGLQGLEPYLDLDPNGSS